MLFPARISSELEPWLRREIVTAALGFFWGAGLKRDLILQEQITQSLRLEWIVDLTRLR